MEYIDKIARDKNRDVLFLLFKDTSDEPDPFNYENFKHRNEAVEWLTNNNIPFYPCSGVANENSMGEFYNGNLYIDVPYDETDLLFLKLSGYLEHNDGSQKVNGIIFGYYPLELAMKNKHHDEPDFWDNLYKGDW
ncbi:MAG: hypothetical protein ACI9ES_003513 [Oceanospirillaceae bacterium]|jgi:hypothetical protein